MISIIGYWLDRCLAPIRTLKNFSRCRQVGVAGVAVHQCQFIYALFAIQTRHIGYRAFIHHLLLNLIMLIAKGSQLREMGHAHHLVAARQMPHFFSHHKTNPAANSLVDFIKYQGGDVICLR